MIQKIRIQITESESRITGWVIQNDSNDSCGVSWRPIIYEWRYTRERRMR